MAKLIFPQEIEVWYILPAIRKKIALKLVEKNIAQKEVAEIMGITPAAISQYKKQKRAKEEFFDQEMEKELDKSVGEIIKDYNCLAKEIIRLNELLKKKKIICKFFEDICALSKDKINCPYCQKK